MLFYLKSLCLFSYCWWWIRSSSALYSCLSWNSPAGLSTYRDRTTKLFMLEEKFTAMSLELNTQFINIQVTNRIFKQQKHQNDVQRRFRHLFFAVNLKSKTWPWQTSTINKPAHLVQMKVPRQQHIHQHMQKAVENLLLHKDTIPG